MYFSALVVGLKKRNSVGSTASAAEVTTILSNAALAAENSTFRLSARFRMVTSLPPARQSPAARKTPLRPGHGAGGDGHLARRTAEMSWVTVSCVATASSRIVESSDPMNTGSRIPHTIRCASRWVSGGAAGTAAAATGASIDSSLHSQGRPDALEKRGGCAYLPDALGRASDSSPFGRRGGGRLWLIPASRPIRPRPVTQSNGFLADFAPDR